MEEKYYLVRKDALPSIYEKVVYAKRLLQNETCKTVAQAAKMAGISRGVYYKYKDKISIFVEKNDQRIYTINVLLIDKIGVLSELLQRISQYSGNILTINQNIPTDGIAPVSISVSMDTNQNDIEALLSIMRSVDGVIRLDLIAKE